MKNEATEMNILPVVGTLIYGRLRLVIREYDDNNTLTSILNP